MRARAELGHRATLAELHERSWRSLWDELEDALDIRAIHALGYRERRADEVRGELLFTDQVRGKAAHVAPVAVVVINIVMRDEQRRATAPASGREHGRA